VEFESFNRQNETIGSHCRLFRTLNKYGKTYEFPVTDVQLNAKDAQRFHFDLSIDLDHKARATVFLSAAEENQSIESKVFVLNQNTKILKVVFGDLQPDTNYGRLCVLLEPVLESGPVFTSMGFLVDLKLERCFLEKLVTDKLKLKLDQQIIGGKMRSKNFQVDYSSLDKIPPRLARQMNGAFKNNDKFSVISFLLIVVSIMFLWWILQILIYVMCFILNRVFEMCNVAYYI